MQQALFAKADVNGDGQLSSDEFASIGQNLPSSGNSDRAEHHRGGGPGAANFSSETMGSLLSLQQSLQSSGSDRSAEIFASADADGDGTLTADELAADMAAHAPPGASGDTATMAADLVSKGDTDGDGTLSSGEFAALKPPGGPLPGGPPPGGPPPSDASSSDTASTDATSYDPADTNKDGQVSMSELLASLQSAAGQLSGFSSDASDLFAKLLSSLAQSTETTSDTTSVSLAA
jgi:Ca2+-binding EF-hand superfamily protein